MQSLWLITIRVKDGQPVPSALYPLARLRRGGKGEGNLWRRKGGICQGALRHLINQSMTDIIMWYLERRHQRHVSRLRYPFSSPAQSTTRLALLGDFSVSPFFALSSTKTGPGLDTLLLPPHSLFVPLHKPSLHALFPLLCCFSPEGVSQKEPENSCELIWLIMVSFILLVI